MKYNSIAMIETNGLVTSITALEAMLKIGNIEFLKREVITNGQVTIFISGEATNLKRVLQAGEIAAKGIGAVIASSLIENPTKDILDVIFDSKQANNRQKRSKKKNEEAEKVDTLFDTVTEDAIVEEATKAVNRDEIIIADEKGEASEKVFEEVEDANNSLDNKSLVLLEESDHETESKDELVFEENASKEYIVSQEKIAEEEEKNNTEVSTNFSGIEVEEKIEDKVEEILTEKNMEIIEDRVSDEVESDKEIADVLEENLVNMELVKDSVPEELEQETDASENENLFENMTHIERLKAEAKLEIEADAEEEYSVPQKNDEEKEEPTSISPEEILLNSNELSVEEELPEDISTLEEDSEYSKMNVPQLRKLARSNPDFPIKGRDISKANRKVLVDYFNQIS